MWHKRGFPKVGDAAAFHVSFAGLRCMNEGGLDTGESPGSTLVKKVNPAAK